MKTRPFPIGQNALKSSTKGPFSKGAVAGETELTQNDHRVIFNSLSSGAKNPMTSK